MSRVASLPFKVVLETNGSLMTPEAADHLSGLFGPERLQCMTSLDHCTAQRHDPFRGRGSFDRAVRAIQLLKDKGFYIHANRMVTPRNPVSREDALAHLDFCRSVGVDSVYFSRVVDIEHKFSTGLVLEPASIMRAWEILKDLRHPCFDPEANLSFLEYGRPDCPKMQCNSFNVNAHGLSPCLFMPDVILGSHDQLDRLIAEGAFRRFATARAKAVAETQGAGPRGCSECSQACRNYFRHASAEVVNVEIG
jgi:MoaA/NifB/PqqE/SkfB family radical SAM enzyme